MTNEFTQHLVESFSVHGHVFCCNVKTGVEQTKGNEGPYSFIPIWGPSSRKLPNRLLCVHQIRKFLENFLN